MYHTCIPINSIDFFPIQHISYVNPDSYLDWQSKKIEANTVQCTHLFGTIAEAETLGLSVANPMPIGRQSNAAKPIPMHCQVKAT